MLFFFCYLFYVFLGILDKKKGLWSRRRMFLLTEGPRLFYVDPKDKELKVSTRFPFLVYSLRDRGSSMWIPRIKNLKVHKREKFFVSDFEFFTIL
jgi:hypothetical protein